MPFSHRRLFEHCQVLLTTLIVVVIAGLLFGVWWINRNGFEGQWGDQVSTELANRGLHADFDSIRFSPIRGLIAKNVVIYGDESREHAFAKIPSLLIDIDRAQAVRGNLIFGKLVLADTKLSLPLPSAEHETRPLTLDELSAKITLDRQGRLLLERGKGRLGKLDFVLDVELDHFDLSSLGKSETEEEDNKTGDLIDAIFSELANWQLPTSQPALLEVGLRGSLQDASNICTSFSFEAPRISRKNYTVKSVLMAGELHDPRLVIDQFEFSDESGQLTGRFDYHLKQQAGRYELTSAIQLSTLFRECFDINTLDDLTSKTAPKITAHGEITRKEDGSTEAVTQGRLQLQDFRFRDVPYQSLESKFSWRNEDLFLRDLSLKSHQGGALEGDLLIKGDDIRYKVTSDLPLASVIPLIEPDSGISRALSRVRFGQKSHAHLETSGWIQRSKKENWSVNGNIDLGDITFNDSALKSLKMDFTMSPDKSSFDNIESFFDYKDYPQYKQYGGGDNIAVEADKISFDRSTKLVNVVKLRGTAWTGPVLRLFNPKLANYVEKTYRAHAPPTFTANGIVDIVKPYKKTNLKIPIRSAGTMEYTFLGKDLTFSKPSFDLQIRQDRVDIWNLAFNTFKGTSGGNLTFFIPPKKPVRFQGGFKWTRLHLADIGRTYGFEKAEQGLVTGRLDFSGTSGLTQTLNGQGNIGLENGHLFFVPVLGPLSAPLGEILGNKRSSHEEARNASCTFAITNGTIHTSDFLTSTPSSVFTGEGSIDLNRDVIDMTVRMNARGLLGLITLPLRPLNGLFQFRGTGPISDPRWRNSNFTSPSKGKDDPIFRKASKAQIVEEP